MGSQYAARLGVLLALDMAEFQKGVDSAITNTRKLTAAIKKDANAASKDIQSMRYAVEDFGKEVTNVTKMQRMLYDEGGKYYMKAKSDQGFAAVMLREAAALDKKYESQKKVMGQSEGMNRYLKSALAYQTTDIVTSLAGGQNPMMVLLQQGGQLRDQFGGFKPLFAGIASAVSLAGVAMVTAGAAIGTFAYAAYKGSVEFAKLRDDLILTNNYAGLTQGSFIKLSSSLSDHLNVSMGDAKDIFSALAASGKFTAANMDSVAYAIGTVAKLSGESADAVAQRLIPSFDGTTSSAQRLNSQYHFLTLEQYKYIEQLNRQGKLQEAIEFTAGALNSSLQKQTRELGFLESAWSKTGKAASEFWNMMLEIGKPSTLQDAVDNSRKAMLSASEALMGPMSPLAKANAEKLFQQSVEAYKKASADLAAEKDKTLKTSEQKAKDQAKIENYAKAGGAEKAASYQAEFEKLKADEVFQTKMFNATEMEKVSLESEKRIADKRVELAKASQTEIGQFSGAQAKIMAQFETNEKLKVAQEIQKINREEVKVVEARQTTEKNSLDMEKQKMGIYQSNFFITEQEAKLAEARLETEQQIAKIIADEKLTADAKEKLVAQQKAIGDTKAEIIGLADKLQYVKDVNSAVFSSMTTAIEAFVITGKFSMENFVKSILASFVKIQAEWMALSMMRGLGSVFSGIGGATGSTSTATVTDYSTSWTPPAAADGGFINGPTLVGENGPELFVPQGAGTIIPNQQMNNYGGGQAQNVFNGPYIANMSAIDTQSGVQFLTKNKMTIWAANQSANRSVPAGR